MRVLLTRPLNDSLETAKILHQKNIETVIEPIFEVVERDMELLNVENYQALIFTSRHAVTFFAKKSPVRDIPVYCVGDHTAEIAQENHFTTIISAEGNQDDLAALIEEQVRGKLLRLTGYSEADELVQRLQRSDFDIDTAQIYEIVDNQNLSPETLALLQDGALDGVVFFSPKTLSRFYALVHKHGVAASCGEMIAWCISDKAANSITDPIFKEIRIAKRPNRKELLELIF